MNQTQEPSLEQVLEMTREMFDLANEGSWEKLLEIEAPRQQILASLFENTSPVEPSSPKGLQIRQIMDIDQKIQALANEAKSSVRDELLGINKIRNQAKAYQAK